MVIDIVLIQPIKCLLLSHGDVQNVNYDVVMPGKNREVKTDALGN